MAVTDDELIQAIGGAGSPTAGAGESGYFSSGGMKIDRHTPDQRRYHRLATLTHSQKEAFPSGWNSGIVLPRTLAEGGSSGCDPNASSRVVFFDPHMPDGGELDVAKITEEISVRADRIIRGSVVYQNGDVSEIARARARVMSRIIAANQESTLHQDPAGQFIAQPVFTPFVQPEVSSPTPMDTYLVNHAQHATAGMFATPSVSPSAPKLNESFMAAAPPPAAPLAPVAPAPVAIPAPTIPVHFQFIHGDSETSELEVPYHRVLIAPTPGGQQLILIRDERFVGTKFFPSTSARPFFVALGSQIYQVESLGVSFVDAPYAYCVLAITGVRDTQ